MTALGRNRGAACQAPSGRLTLGRMPMILMYHSVADVTEDPNQLCVTPGRFAEQMATLQRLGLRGVSMGTLVDAMRHGRQRGLVGITFDDGYLSVLESALPELRRRGFTASVFIISDRLGGTNEWDDGPAWPLLSGHQVGELAAAGMEIAPRTRGSRACRPAGSKRRSARAEPA
jgi:peptidoglycan/xylan/chitin deacetylase (PgdA/CDA1 family)